MKCLLLGFVLFASTLASGGGYGDVGYGGYQNADTFSNGYGAVIAIKLELKNVCLPPTPAYKRELGNHRDYRGRNGTSKRNYDSTTPPPPPCPDSRRYTVVRQSKCTCKEIKMIEEVECEKVEFYNLPLSNERKAWLGHTGNSWRGGESYATGNRISGGYGSSTIHNYNIPRNENGVLTATYKISCCKKFPSKNGPYGGHGGGYARRSYPNPCGAGEYEEIETIKIAIDSRVKYDESGDVECSRLPKVCAPDAYASSGSLTKMKYTIIPTGWNDGAAKGVGDSYASNSYGRDMATGGSWRE